MSSTSTTRKPAKTGRLPAPKQPAKPLSSAIATRAQVEHGVVVRKTHEHKQRLDEQAQQRPLKPRRRVKGHSRKAAFGGAAGPALLSAKNADKYDLYQRSVQKPLVDAHFLGRIFKQERGRQALRLREDFCGTGLLCASWVGLSKEHHAEGFDIDPEPVSWGMTHNFEQLGADATRIAIHLKDVREPSYQRPDVRVALNFSYFCFHTRKELLAYFRAARADLAPDGMFCLDIHGGPESCQDLLEESSIDKAFTYVWDQASYSPISGLAWRYISFKFKDGTSLQRAFRYHWRMWGLQEVRDVLLDAGFRSVDVYWEGTDVSGKWGNGVFRKSEKGENCDSWVVWVVAKK